MGRKDLPGWLKGGIILLSIGLVIGLYYSYNVSIFFCNINDEVAAGLSGIAFQKCNFNQYFPEMLKMYYRLDFWIFFSVIPFLIGAIIGGIIEKVRAKKR